MRGPDSWCLHGPVRSGIAEAVQLHVEENPVHVRQVQMLGALVTAPCVERAPCPDVVLVLAARLCAHRKALSFQWLQTSAAVNE